MTPERLATFTNADEQTEAQVHRDHRGGATVRLVDLDSGEVCSALISFPAGRDADAIAKAREIAGGSK